MQKSGDSQAPTAQRGPDQPGSQAQLPPFTHIPWPLQPASALQLLGDEQFVTGSHPSSQRQYSEELSSHIPCPEQSTCAQLVTINRRLAW